MTGQRRSPGCAARRWLTGVLVGALLAAPANTAAAPEEDCAPAPPPGTLRPIAGPPPSPFPLASTFGSAPAGVAAAVPAVAIRVRAPASGEKDRDLTYRFVVENTAPASAHHVTARIAIPATAARFVRARPEPDDRTTAYVWKLGSLRGGERREITLVVQPTGDEELSCCARVQFEHGQCVRTRVGLPRPGGPRAVPGEPPVSPTPASPPLAPTTPAQPSLEVRLNAPGEAVRYDIFTCKAEVFNRGRATAKGVVLQHALPKELSFLNSKPANSGDDPLVWNLGDLPAGASKLVEYQVVAKGSGRLVNNVVVRAEGSLKHEATHTVRVGQPGLSVVQSGAKQRGVGRPTTFEITVANSGDLPTTGVQITDELPEDIEFLSASLGGRFEAGKVRWSLGSLPPGTRQTVKLVVRARRPGTFRNVCTVAADRGLTEQARAETRFEPAANLTVEIDKDRDPVPTGQEAYLTLRVRNAGRAAETNVDVHISLPEGMKVLELRGPTATDTRGPKVRLPRLDRLPAGSERVAVLRVRVEKPGEMRLNVETASDSTGPDKTVKTEETLTVLEPSRGPTHTTARW